MWLEGPWAFHNQTEGKLSWRYIYFALSDMSSKVIARCPRIGKASRAMLEATVLTHVSRCQEGVGPELSLWMDVSLCTQHQGDVSHDRTSFDMCGAAVSLWETLPGIRCGKLWPEGSVSLMSNQNGNSILWRIYTIIQCMQLQIYQGLFFQWQLQEIKFISIPVFTGHKPVIVA